MISQAKLRDCPAREHALGKQRPSVPILLSRNTCVELKALHASVCTSSVEVRYVGHDIAWYGHHISISFAILVSYRLHMLIYFIENAHLKCQCSQLYSGLSP
jgi:hypothetical protein